ncbi:hypothetical protein SLEP1_g26325 [Rubroshorea leprosula]|uniref:Uncharacterized protein n=1 Tax=Rubroshorea leprosula TaxID=152421 RepID=A0AAV5JW88_9ROSI|nr:hypothetical protein SLEP1_g26325 [Rubroshorea leprosula]
MNFGSFDSSEEFDSPLTLSDLDLSPLKEVSESYEIKEMSSKETLSIEGSEEVRALEYGSEGMESGSSGLERTEDEVSGKEIIKGGEEGMPLNILKIEGKGNRCYNVEVDIVSKVKGYKTELGTRDSLIHLVENYDLPPQVLLRPIGVEEKACSAPRDHWMPMYTHYLTARLSVGPSSIKGWKEKFFFVDDTKWERRDVEVEFLSSWKAKKANQNKYSLNSDEEEEVEKLVREGGDILDIMYLTSLDVIDAAKLYEPSSLSEVEMERFLCAIGGLAIPKKPRKKSKISDVASKGRT